MNIIAVSINHRSAPAETREALHLNEDEIKSFLKDLKGNLVNEGFVLSTCNRTEIYGIPVDPAADFHQFQKFLTSRKNVNGLSEKNFQNFFSCGAVNHLFKVSAGIDSLLIGDNQILGQVKEAFQKSEENDLAGFLMKRVFDSAIKVGKRAKTETEISDGAITVSYAAVQLIEKIFSSLSRKSALVIGTGETGEIAAKHLHDKGIGNLAVTNRTIEKAEKLSSQIHAKILPFQFFKEYLHDYDIIISATSAPEYMINYEDINNAMRKKNYASTVIMDIAVPRDVDPKVRDIDNVFYHDIDSLKIIVEQNMKKRQGEIPKVQKIIMEELVSLFGWYNSLEITPTIKSLRDHFEEIRSDEVNKLKNKFSQEDYEKLEILTKRIVNKLLHQPTVELKKISESGSDNPETAERIEILRNLFGLNSNNGKH